MNATICKPLRNAKNETDIVSRTFEEWVAARQKACDDTSEVVRLWVKLVNTWKDLIAMIKSFESSGELTNTQNLVESIHPYLTIVRNCWLFTKQQRAFGADYECPSAFSSDFDRAVTDMEEITLYIESLRNAADEDCDNEFSRFDDDVFDYSDADDFFDLPFTKTVTSSEGAQRLKMALAAGLAVPTSPAIPISMR